MKILIVTYGLNTLGGLQNWQHIFAHELLKEGNNITILEMYDYSKTRPDQNHERSWDPNIKIIHHNGPIVQRGINPKTNWAAMKIMINIFEKFRLSKYIMQEKFDSILFTDPNFTFFFFKSALKANNCVVQFHSSFSRFKTTSRIRYFLTKRRHQSYTKFIFLSKGDMNEAIQNGFVKDKIGYMNNFINESKFACYTKQDFKVRKQILVVGNLDNPDKQIDHILYAFSMIEKEVTSDWIIKIIGDGEHKNKLVQLSNELRIAANVEFAGKKSNPAQDFFESSFYVLSSSFEGAPLTLLECIFSNLPAISYDCSPFIHEIIDDGHNGCIVEKNNIKELSNAIRYLILNPNVTEAMSLRLNEIKHIYSIESSIKRWETLFANENHDL